MWIVSVPALGPSVISLPLPTTNGVREVGTCGQGLAQPLHFQHQIKVWTEITGRWFEKSDHQGLLRDGDESRRVYDP